MNIHPLANLLPAMSEAEYRALVESIRANGLREPVVVDAATGELIDGRHRYRACKELGIMPRSRSLAFDSPEARIAFVLDANLHRRHLDESQRAMVAKRLANMKEGRPEKTASIEAVSQNKAADLLNVSRSAVQRAAIVIEHGTPELQSAVESASVPVSVAANVARMPQMKQRAFVEQVQEGKKPPHQIVAAMKREEKRQEITQKALSSELPTDRKYPVVYADPPWRYEETPMGHTNRSIENHYPTMTADEIRALPVKDLAAEDSILFLWATVPNLPLALSVMESWGFAYKSHLVWDKVHMGTGYHTRNQHELLLIGRRGELPLPEPSDVPASVVRIERTAHSEKPSEFAALIERMYPGLPRIELFARVSRPGWERWGYESPAEETPSEPPNPALAAFFDPPKKSKRFAPPSLSEVSAYMTEIGIPHLADSWFDHYSANGWKVGSNPMKDWQASCRTWKRNHERNPLTVASTRKDERDMTIQDRVARMDGWLKQGGFSGG